MAAGRNIRFAIQFLGDDGIPIEHPVVGWIEDEDPQHNLKEWLCQFYNNHFNHGQIVQITKVVINGLALRDADTERARLSLMRDGDWIAVHVYTYTPIISID